jgi:hypothetical protein
MGSLHDLALEALRKALLSRTEALLRTLETVFEERSLQAALQARRQLAELRAVGRFLEERALQRECVQLQRVLLAQGHQVMQGVAEPQSRPLLRLALQIHWHAHTLAQPGHWRKTHGQRAVALAPDLPGVLLQKVRTLLFRHAGLGAVNADGAWQALRGAALLAGVLPAGVLLEIDDVKALLRWEQHLLSHGQTPSELLLQEFAARLQALCDEAGATPAMRQSLASQSGPLGGAHAVPVAAGSGDPAGIHVGQPGHAPRCATDSAPGAPAARLAERALAHRHSPAWRGQTPLVAHVAAAAG